ncbi:nuclear transport factor 2 family protein [Sphingobium mellinum]|uniref:nuclear transport factor 2 family protein n=1 Tax=Sphingobium mellinum TaxID=1387166 RepID=UPI0030ED037E
MSLEDKIEIHDLCHRYALCIDSYRIDDWVALFTPDVVFDEREFEFGLHEGREAVRAYGHVLRETTRHMSHLMSNHLVENISDGSATGTVTGLVEAMTNDLVRTRYLVLYQDEYRKCDGAWKIHRRVLKKTFDPEVLSI